MKKYILALLCALLCPLAGGLHAQSGQPILRLDPGMHTAVIGRISADASGRLALTASNDKTARLWSLTKDKVSGRRQGRLLRVLRPPIGAGDEGKLYAGALSPDGALAALGGWTGYEWDKNVCIYLFDTASGRLLRRLPGHPNIISDLAFSASGRTLAAALHTGGLRLWDVARGRELAADSDYADRCYGLDWHGDARLAVSCYDGALRLYKAAPGGRLTLLAKRAAPGGKRPFAVRFSPDGTRLAVGFTDSTAVNVLDGRTLAFLHAPASTARNGDLSKVAWTGRNNSLALHAAGRWDVGGWNPLRRWPQGGKGRARDLRAALSTVMDLRPLPDGSLLFAAADPSWGTASPAAFARPAARTIGGGESPAASGLRTLGANPLPDFRRDTLRLSADASVVAFGFEDWGKRPATFSLHQRALREGPPPKALRPPRFNGLSVAGWKSTREPKLNGRPLPLKKYETSQSLAVAADAAFFLLGTEWHLRCYEKNGRERWKRPVPGAAWAVNLSRDSALAVAACGDGTIRWHRADTGRELLAFFPHPDGKRWVAWTPQGYYDASSGGEALIGWHVNRGKDSAADFFPAGKFRDRFHRPDIVGRVLVTKGSAAAVEAANKAAGRRQEADSAAVLARMAPPVVELRSGGAQGEIALAPRETALTLRYALRRKSPEPVRRVRVLVDGAAASGGAQPPIPAEGKEAAFAVKGLPAGRDVIVSVLAETRYAVSEPAVLRISRQGPAVKPSTIPNALKPKLYLLAVGVSDYKLHSDLEVADDDARAIAAAFQRQEGKLYGKVEAKVLVDEKATAGDVLDGFEWIKKQTTSKDVAVVFLAGHGENDEELRYYFCPHDYDSKRRLRTGVSFETIRNTLRSAAGKTLFFIDTCHAGNALGKLAARSGGGADIDRVVNELSDAENGVVVFAASTGRQVSREDAQNGFFTKAVVEGLKGKADLLGNGTITISSLETYIAERVKKLSGGTQSPTVAKPETIPNFPIAVRSR